MKDYYKMLGLRFEAESEEIRQAYRQKAVEMHPDKNQGDIYYEEKFKEIQEAYSVLTNLKLKQEYDLQYKSRIDFVINRDRILDSLPEEKLPHYVQGVYELEIKEYKKELAKLYSDIKVVDEYLYKSFALARFQYFTDRAPKFDNYLKKIKYYRDTCTKSIKETSDRLIRFPADTQEDFYNEYCDYLINAYHGEITLEQLSIRCLFLPSDLKIEEKKIIAFEYYIMVLHFSSFLHEKNKYHDE